MGRLLPFRLLCAAGVLHSSRGGRSAALLNIDALPYQLKGFSFSSIPRLLYYPREDSTGARFFSSRTARTRTGGSGGGGSTDNLRGGDIRSRGAARQAKSLIEDEAELSDWISDLKTHSFRLGGSSDSEQSDHGQPMSSKGKDRDGGRGRFRSRDSKGDSLGPSRTRGPSRRHNDDNFSDFSDRRKSWSTRGSPMKKTFGSYEDEIDIGFSSRRRKNSASCSERASTSTVSRGRKDFGYNFKQSRPTRMPSILASDEEEEDDNEDGDLSGFEDNEDDIGSPSRKRKDIGNQGRRTSPMAKSRAKDCKSVFKHSGSVRKPVPLVSEDEDEDMSGFDDDFFSSKVGCKDEPLKDELMGFDSSEKADEDNSQQVPRRSTGDDESYLSQTRFDECSISPLTLKGIKAAGYERMTVVQEATLPVILKGKDVLAKAKTGTGKTVAFLLPAIEVVSKLPPVDRDQRRPPINVLVVCPTRELADQAAAEAIKLLKYHPSIGVQVIMGGTRLALEQKRMQTNPCQFLVATPGRLRDHIENTPGFATRLAGVKVLVLDEADRLLDMGFRKDIEQIIAAVPKQRQTLLFSATVPDEVRQICYIAMKRDLEFINTVEEGSEETHSQVKQMHLVAPLEKQFSLLYRTLIDHISENVDYKVIVFCTTAMVTKLVADILSELKLNVREIHSRKPQSYRMRVSKEFKESKGLILVSSDVSARGVDYPNVTLVVQLGVPADREQYIHRLGRTGRKGKEGVGLLILAPWEDFFLRSIRDLPITEVPIPSIDLDTRKKVDRALAHVEQKNKESAYQAWLGYYNSNNVGRDKYQLVALANEFSRSMGLDNPPAIPKLVVRKMGLSNVPGLRTK